MEFSSVPSSLQIHGFRETSVETSLEEASLEEVSTADLSEGLADFSFIAIQLRSPHNSSSARQVHSSSQRSKYPPYVCVPLMQGPIQTSPSPDKPYLAARASF